jgi:hypothetical protein
MKRPEGLCDSSSKSYSGYLDISDDAHLFYWFFESRSASPEKDPLVLWLNGGPGCSSTTGLLFELGPCRIADEGKNTTYNPYSWTESANVIFLDSPVQVGYSYGSKTVSNSQDTAEDVYSFLQLFYEKFPKFKDVDFHISGGACRVSPPRPGNSPSRGSGLRTAPGLSTRVGALQLTHALTAAQSRTPARTCPTSRASSTATTSRSLRRIASTFR